MIPRRHYSFTIATAVLWLITSNLTTHAGVVPCKASIDPIPFTLHDETVLAYELYVGTGSKAKVPTPVKVVVRSENASGEVLLELSGDRLTECVRAPYDANPYLTVYMWVTLQNGASLPVNLWNEVHFESAGSTSCKAPVSAAATDFAPPLLGGPWMAGNGSSNLDHHHRWFVIQYNQAEYASQRFGVDWIKVDKKGNAFENDGKKNRDWYGYGEPLLAVADGTVMDAKDGTPDNDPFGPRAIPITSNSVLGNFVLLKLEDGRHVAYAHFIPGTVKVKPLQKVKKGQLLGKLGNSGNSDVPHLHMHVCEGTDMLFSHGIPYMFDRYKYVGHFEDQVYYPEPPVAVMNQMPGLNDAVVFHGSGLLEEMNDDVDMPADTAEGDHQPEP